MHPEASDPTTVESEQAIQLKKFKEALNDAAQVFESSAHFKQTEPETSSPDYLMNPNLLAALEGGEDLVCHVIYDEEQRPVGALIGCTAGWHRNREERQTGKTGFFMWQIAVRDDMQGKGTLRRLVNEVARSLPDRVSHLSCGVLADNAGMRAICEGQKLGPTTTAGQQRPTEQFPQGGFFYRIELPQDREIAETPWQGVSAHVSPEKKK